MDRTTNRPHVGLLGDPAPVLSTALSLVALAAFFSWPEVPAVELAAQLAVLLAGCVFVGFGTQLLAGARTLILDYWNVAAFVLFGAILSHLFGWSATAAMLVVQALWGGFGALRARSG